MATAREKENIRALLAEIPNPCIVELGAHTGEEEGWFRKVANGSLHHIMVEPDMRNVKYLLDKPTGNARRVIVAAVSDKDGVAEFHFSENPRDNNHASGSLRKPTGHLEHLPWITFPHTGIVPTMTLDTLFEQERLKVIDLLWVDIQGAERNMIAGGKKALGHTRYLFMEAEEIELYEGEALKAELVSLLPGWTLLADFGSNILLRNENCSEPGKAPANVPVPVSAVPSKLIGIMPVRNEDWCLDLTLRGALAWCDGIVVLDHACTDNSLAIIHRISAEQPGKVQIIHESNPAWDEMRHRQMLLEAARGMGATHIAMIDADEALSAPIAAHIRQAIFNLPDKTVLQVPWIILRGSLRRFHKNGIWGDRWVSMAFKDSPGLRWEGDTFHHREPFGTEHAIRFAGHEHGGILHLWGVSERRLRAKHALYKMTERIRWPEKTPREINLAYNFWRGPTQANEPPWEFGNVPEEWWAGYDLSAIRECGDVPWQEVECATFTAQYGQERFAGLDLFGLDKIYMFEEGPLLKIITRTSPGPKIIFSLCHATARFPQWRIAANKWFETADHPERIEYLLAIHKDNARDVSPVELPHFAEHKIVVNHKRSCSVDNWNSATDFAQGQILLNIADDWFPCEHWDTKLLELIPDLSAEVAVDVDTGSTGYPNAHDLLPFSIITRPYLERLKSQYGYDGFFYPEYTSMYSDEEFTWIARRDGVVLPAWQHFFEHRHPVHGKALMDDVYRKQNAPEHYAAGKKLMDRRLKEFGISLVQALPPRPKLAICAPGEWFSKEWVGHWTALITTLDKIFDMDAGTHKRGVGPIFSYSTNVYVTRAGMLGELLESPHKPDYVLWLDDDNLVAPHLAIQLVQDLIDNSELDAVAGWCFLERAGLCTSVGMLDPAGQIQFMTHADLMDAPQDVQVIDGTGFPLIVMRYSLLEKVGPTAFHPRFSEYFRWGFSGEDVSFCLRAREVGAKIAVDRRVEVPHMKWGQFRPQISTPSQGNSPQEKTA